uniref:Diacylglycerol kinase n=1 Tax=Amphiprion percula TaxID=161767 RepID=A0A3P8S0W2_AMPPE
CFVIFVLFLLFWVFCCFVPFLWSICILFVSFMSRCCFASFCHFRLNSARVLQDTFHHHWREGNLASASRCEVCRRSCGSSDVLAGMRCEWCGITVRKVSLNYCTNSFYPGNRCSHVLFCGVLERDKEPRNDCFFPNFCALFAVLQCNRLGADICPLLVFVNPKSGGLKGRELLYSFRKLLNPHQVFDISNGGPSCKIQLNMFLCSLHTFREVPRFRVLVCGGDGTVGWVLGVLEAVRHKLVCREPPIGIVPLGTGNDLARILRWGTGYSGEDPHHILVSVDEADEVLMDRWTILLDAQDISEDGKNNGFLEPPKVWTMNNYFGIGIDAELSLDFHLAREDEPDKFTSRFHNKGVYVKVGLQKISHTRSLHKELQLQVDAQNIPLPNIEGLIFLNIPSWGAGADLWGSEVDGRFGKPSIDDGLLEVVGVTGVVHMGQVQSGLRSGIRIAQGNYIRLTVSKPIPVQVDGEPWIQPPGHIIISAAGPKVGSVCPCRAPVVSYSPGVLASLLYSVVWLL